MKLRCFLASSLAFSITICSLARAQSFGDLKDLTMIRKDVRSKRISSFDRSGGMPGVRKWAVSLISGARR